MISRYLRNANGNQNLVHRIFNISDELRKEKSKGSD